MTNRELINKLMEQPLDAVVNIDCGACSCGTMYSGSNTPVISHTRGTFGYLNIRVNDGFKSDKVRLDSVHSKALVKEIEKRMVACNE